MMKIFHNSKSKRSIKKKYHHLILSLRYWILQDLLVKVQLIQQKNLILTIKELIFKEYSPNKKTVYINKFTKDSKIVIMILIKKTCHHLMMKVTFLLIVIMNILLRTIKSNYKHIQSKIPI